MATSARDAVELFHLGFVRALMAKPEDKGLFAVKGGCNLRFFFGSVRYSEDLDLDVSALAKETDTTQRWKAGLRVKGASMPVRTTIEVSRRDAIDGASFESIAPDVLKRHALTPFLASHYAAPRAVAQKIRALAARSRKRATCST